MFKQPANSSKPLLDKYINKPRYLFSSYRFRTNKGFHVLHVLSLNPKAVVDKEEYGRIERCNTIDQCICEALYDSAGL